MKDYKQLFGYAAILFGIGFVIRSFMPAYAFNGPSVSMGSNPIEHHSEACHNTTLFTNNSANSFIITDIIGSGYNAPLELKIDGQKVIDTYSTGIAQLARPLASGLVVPSGSVVTCDHHGGLIVTISGYYTH